VVVLVSPKHARRRRGPALVLAVCAHLLALLGLGWRIPRTTPQGAPDALPPIEIILLRPTVASPAAPAPAASSRVSPRPAASRQPGALAPPPLLAAPAAPAVAEGPPDCEPEDLPLLTDAEKARCRNQIDAANGRRLAREADARIAKEVARANAGPRIDAIPAEKRAYYDAVAEAYKGPGHGPKIECPVSIPLLGGVEINKNIFAKKKGSCHVVPPQGVLTEELGITPP
jgi:hypothetical protein